MRHEINNPPAALMLNLEMLKEGVHEDSGELIEGIGFARMKELPRRCAALRGFTHRRAYLQLEGK